MLHIYIKSITMTRPVEFRVSVSPPDCPACVNLSKNEDILLKLGRRVLCHHKEVGIADGYNRIVATPIKCRSSTYNKVKDCY